MSFVKKYLAAKKRGNITPAAARRLASFKPFSRPTPSLGLLHWTRL
jgi:hypothetical protein